MAPGGRTFTTFCACVCVCVCVFASLLLLFLADWRQQAGAIKLFDAQDETHEQTGPSHFNVTFCVLDI